MTTPVNGPVRVGTRRSLLARTQSETVAAALRAALGRDVVLVEVTTEGDVSSAPLASLGGTGVFVSALRDALLRGEVDLAVHSLKDLPTALDERITLAAVPLREDPRDVVVARDGLTLGELRAGPRSCARSVSVSTWSEFVATWTPGSARSRRARWTRSCWPGRASPGSTGWTR